MHQPLLWASPALMHVPFPETEAMVAHSSRVGPGALVRLLEAAGWRRDRHGQFTCPACALYPMQKMSLEIRADNIARCQLHGMFSL